MLEYSEIKLEIDNMLFTWDDEKEKINIRKHGVNFATAAATFLDTDALFENNSIDDFTGEERLDIIGMAYGNLMFVVYVERTLIDDNDIIRIISARKAEREERRRYVNGA